MSWYVNRDVKYELPKCNDTFLEDLKEQGIVIPDDVVINQGTKVLENSLWETVEVWGMVQYFGGGVSESWGGFENRMKDISKKFPSILFTVHCKSGEDGVSMWREYYKGGFTYSQTPTITYRDFDENLLK